MERRAWGVFVNRESDYRLYLLHVFALNGFAVAQPVFEKLGGNADFFVARGSQMTDFMVLASLRRLGAPYQATPSTLYNVLERSSGGMTKVIKRLDAMGLVERTPDPADGRGSLVRLTERGIDIHGKAFHSFVEGSNALLAEASVTRGKELDRSLQFLIRAFEDYQGN